MVLQDIYILDNKVAAICLVNAEKARLSTRPFSYGISKRIEKKGNKPFVFRISRKNTVRKIVLKLYSYNFKTIFLTVNQSIHEKVNQETPQLIEVQNIQFHIENSKFTVIVTPRRF